MAGRDPCLLTQLTVEGVFEDFEGRRAGLVKALTTDVEEFYKQCDPENVNLCLFGLPSGKWEVNLPAEEVPPELPEPALGINFARDVMGKRDWLSLVAAHSEAWLLAVAYFLGIRIGFDKADRKRLFHMINDLPSLFEVVTCTAEKEVKKKKMKSSISKKMQSKYEHEGKKNVEDMDGGDQQSVKGVFRDFRGRRTGLLKALTTDVEEFFQLCDPEKENLFLYGFPSKKWEVSFPLELLLELPEPALGINFARDAMQKMDWLSLIAAHSDAWLLSVAYFFGARFDKADRYSSRLLDGERTLQYGMERLFDKINNLPTLFEVVSQTAEKEVMEKSSNSNRGINESKSNLMEDYESQGKDAEEAAKERSEDEYLKEYGDTMCGVCGLFLSFTGNIFGRWQMTIGNGYDPCPKRKI